VSSKTQVGHACDVPSPRTPLNRRRFPDTAS
jgi:hypothetical protein